MVSLWWLLPRLTVSVALRGLHPCLGRTSVLVSVAFASVELHLGLSDTNVASICMSRLWGRHATHSPICLLWGPSSQSE